MSTYLHVAFLFPILLLLIHLLHPSHHDASDDVQHARGAHANLRGARALITETRPRALTQEAILRIKNLSEHVERGTKHTDVALCGISRSIAGWPNSQIEHWEGSGAAQEHSYTG